jgi:hypothetical protein
MDQKGGIALTIVLLILLVVLFGSGYLWYRHVNTRYVVHNDSANGVASRTGSASTSLSGIPSDIPDWLIYQNTEFHFTLQYPADWKIDEQSELTPNSIDLAPQTAILPQELGDAYTGGAVHSYLSIEPGTCESIGADDQTSTLEVNGVEMEKASRFPATSTGSFAILHFSGNSTFGWDATCNTIRLYVPRVDPQLRNASGAREYLQDAAIENQILASFTLQS